MSPRVYYLFPAFPLLVRGRRGGVGAVADLRDRYG